MFIFIFFLYIYSEQTDAKDVKIISVDIQAISPINGVTTIQGDITDVN